MAKAGSKPGRKSGKLTEMQIRFCEKYAAMIKPNATQAALEAGYSKESAYSIGSENMKKPEIIAFLKTLPKAAKKDSKKDLMSIEEADAILAQIARNPGSKDADRLKATELYYKRHGMLINKTQLSGEDGGPVRFTWENGNG